MQETALRRACSEHGTVQHVKMLPEKGGVVTWTVGYGFMRVGLFRLPRWSSRENCLQWPMSSFQQLHRQQRHSNT